MAKAAYWLASFVAIGYGARANTITNVLDASTGVILYNLAVDAGDTVVWLNTQRVTFGTNFVESYGGEWKSPPLIEGDSFAVTFTNAGFFAYKTGTSRFPRAGVVSVRPLTGHRPPITINMPSEGSILGRYFYYSLLATVPNPDQVVSVDFLANSQPIGHTFAPIIPVSFQVIWEPTNSPGPYVLQAVARYLDGTEAWSGPVNITIGAPDPELWGSRILPSGELLFFYNSAPEGAIVDLVAADSLSFANIQSATPIGFSGVYVDEEVKGGGISTRFYGIAY